MIESRYKIEYELPDKAVKKTSTFKTLWYFVLISLVFITVTAITYDFSYKNISQDASVLFNKAKVNILNLGESPKTDKKDSISPSLKTNEVMAIKEKQPSPNTSNKISKNVTIRAVTEPKDSTEKEIINELTTQQAEQLETIKTKVEENSELTQNLDQVSEKLLFEQQRTQELNSQLAKQEIDRKELEDQLNKALENSVNNEITLDNFTKEEETTDKAETKELATVVTTVTAPNNTKTENLVSKDNETSKVVITANTPQNKQVINEELSTKKETPLLKTTTVTDETSSVTNAIIQEINANKNVTPEPVTITETPTLKSKVVLGETPSIPSIPSTLSVTSVKNDVATDSDKKEQAEIKTTQTAETDETIITKNTDSQAIPPSSASSSAATAEPVVVEQSEQTEQTLELTTQTTPQPAEKSETDKIIEAMQNIASEQNDKQTNTEENKPENSGNSDQTEDQTEDQNNIANETKETTVEIKDLALQENKLNNQQETANTALSDITEQTTIASPVVTQTIENSTLNIENTAEETEVTTTTVEVDEGDEQNKTENQSQDAPKALTENQGIQEEQATKSANNNSAVDDIIAAMEASQTQSNKEVNQDTSNEPEKQSEQNE